MKRWACVLVSIWVVLAAGSLVASGCLLNWSKDNKNTPGNQLNEYLVDNEQSPDFRANIEAAKRLIDSLEKEALDCNNRPLLKAARQFVGLEKLQGDSAPAAGLCQPESIDLVFRLTNSLRVPGSKRHPFANKPDSRKRLNKLVAELAERQMKQCMAGLESRWTNDINRKQSIEKYATIDEFTTKLATKDCGRDKLLGWRNDYAECLIGRADTDLYRKNGARMAVRDALVELDEKETQMKRLKKIDEKTGLTQRTTKTITHDLDKYFWQPCEQFLHDDQRMEILEQSSKMVLSYGLKLSEEIFPGYWGSKMLKWTTNLATCKRLFNTRKELLVKFIYSMLKLGL